MLTFLSKYRFFLGCMLVGSIYVLSLSGQTTVDYEHLPIEQKQFDDTEWQTLQKSLDYSGEKPKAEKKKAEKKEEKEPFTFPDLSRFSVLFKILAILILVSLLSFIIYQVVKKTDLTFEPEGDLSPNDQTNKKLVSLEELEEQLDKHDVSPYIIQAEQARNYPLAVRLHFLALLKKMNEKEWILWKKNYTNNTYLNQMSGKDTYADFKILTKAYERIWYGDRHPAFPEYEILRKQFMDFLSDIK